MIDCTYAKEVLDAEGKAIFNLKDKIDEHFLKAVEMILHCKGQVIVSGMGKPGFIGQKISATFASTGTRSVYIHPAEAAHGDLGRISSLDVVLLISRSGTTEEIVRLIDPLKAIGAKMIAMSCNPNSPLAKHADLVLDLGIIHEPCPLKLAPSASTTGMLAMGDALALTVLKEKKFSKEQFALYHPAGNLGRKLLKVRQVMRVGEESPVISETSTIKEAILFITKAKAGAAICIDNEGKITGIFTDGDLRRYLYKMKVDLKKDILKDFMTKNPKKIYPEKLASEALKILKDYKIGELPVVDDDNYPVGVFNLKDFPKLDIF